MTATLEDLAARLTVLEDIEAIRQLKARYLRSCDLKQVDDVRDTFLPGPIRVEYQNFPVFTDRDAFVAVYEQMACQGGIYDIHHATNAEITLTGADRATGKWSLNFRTIMLAQRSVTRLGVEYEDVYQKRDGRWYIAETKSYVTSMFTEVVGDDGVPTYVAFGEVPAAVPEPA